MRIGKLFPWKYPIRAFIFRLHDNGFSIEPDKARLKQSKGIFYYEFINHTSWKKVKDEYLVTCRGKPVLFLFQTAPGVYMPIKFMTDLGEFTPETIKELEREVYEARKVIEKVQRRIDELPVPNPRESDYKEKLEEYEKKKEEIIKEVVGLKKFEEIKEVGEKAYQRLRDIKAYFYIPREEAKYWFAQKLTETYKKYPSRAEWLKKYLPIGIIIIGFILLLAFWPKIKETLLGIATR